MKGTALILAGGGGKGAYEIGVWKAMKELGIDKKFKRYLVLLWED